MRIFREGGGIIMSLDDNKGAVRLFNFLRAFLFTLFLTLGVTFSYLKSFLPDIRPLTIIPAAIISAVIFSFLFLLKKKKPIFWFSLAALVLFVLIKHKDLLESAGSTFLPLYASYVGDPSLTQNYSFSVSPDLFIIFFVIFFSLITAAVILFALPSIFSLMFSIAVLAVSICFSPEFIDPFSFMLMIMMSAVLLIERRGLIHVGQGAPRPAVISALIFLVLSLILNAAIKPVTYVQNENVKKARLSFEDFILDHTGFYVDVNTGNLMFGDESSNIYAWIGDEKYADVSGGALLRNNSSVMKMEPPESYPAYIKINEYTDYDGRGWAKAPDTEDSISYDRLISVSDTTMDALSDISNAINVRIRERVQRRLEDALSAGTYSYPRAGAPGERGDIERLTAFLNSNEINSSEIVADTVKEYVSKAAIYDKGIEKPPVDSDIADYFLNVSKRGYCIHFATAATLLLRMQGLPARFVTGYMVTEREAGADGKIEIRGDDGHAWCEYYDFDSDLWRRLDATPADLSRSSSTASAQSPGQYEDINPSGEVDDSDMDDTDDEEEDDEDDEETSSDESEGKEPVSNGQAEYDQRMAERGRITWTVIIALAIAIAVFLVSVFLGIRIYRGNLKRGSAKKRILKYYRAIKHRRKFRVIKTKIPDEVLDTVMKARFSEHEMTISELKIVKDYYDSLLSASG